MSMHRKPLTDLEREGLIAHGLGRDIGKPSMLADVFRHGVAWALAAAEKDAERYRLLRRVTSEPALVELLEYLDNNPDTPEKFDAFIDAAMAKEKE